MDEIRYPTLKDVKAMQVTHGKLISADYHSHSQGMMAFSGISDSYTLKEADGEFVLLHSHKSEMDGTDEKLYRADEEALKRIEQIAEQENLWAWERMCIDPEKDDRPKVYDYSSSSGITLYTDDRIGGMFSFNCETAEFYGGGEVVKQIREILFGFVDDEHFISERHLPVTDPNVIEMKKRMFMMPMGTDTQPVKPEPENSGEWKCPECNAAGNTGKFCLNCGTPKPKEEAPKAPEPEQPAQGEFVYTGGRWTCPKCGCDEGEGKFCPGCGSWRPDLDPERGKKTEAEPEVSPIKEFTDSMGVPDGITDMLKAMGLIPEDKADEELTALLSKQVKHGRLISFKHSSWSNGMTPNSHMENRTAATWAESGEVTVSWYSQQGVADAMVTDYKAGEKVTAELEEFIRQSNLTNLSQLKYERSKDPFAGMTDSSGGSDYTICFDDSSVGGDKSALFTLDPAAIGQHGGTAVNEKLRDFTGRLCTESTIVSSHTEPRETGAMGGFMGMGMLGMLNQTASSEQWKCSCCGYDKNGGRFCNNCGAPKK